MKYYARRIGFYIITLWAAISLNFLLPRLMPGDPADIMIAKLQRSGGEVSETTVRNIKLLLGSDDASMWEQYIGYWGRMLRGDLGISVTKYPTPVAELIGQALPWTLILVGVAITLGFVVAGSIVMEQVFTYPGIGKLMFQAVQNSDYALMQGVFLVITLTVLAANFIMDLVYGYIDPRARHNV